MKRMFPEKLEGRHVLYALLGFFGVMLVANGFFLYYAIGTFNGFETKDAYKRGLNYNERIAAEQAQSARGWQPTLRYDAGKDRILLKVVDRNGHPVVGLRVAGEVRRPVTDKSDKALEMHEIAPAVYAADAQLAPGQWTVMAQLYETAASQTPAHQHKQRLWVRQEQ